MKAKLVAESQGPRIWILVLDSGEEVMQALRDFALQHRVGAASFVALGAFRSAVLGYFDLQRRQYQPVPVESQVEAITLVGDIARDEAGKPSVHAHAVLGLPDASTRGGHLLRGEVRPTLEVTVTETPAHLRRTRRPELGIALIDLD
ncbi:MAG TPA: PPC domain-containing DNA-binding protein [Nevskia sp.]|jgi:hypothetical protein|nr:PPC domain-containing DNA-binding protein [Nevskia sp.]